MPHDIDVFQILKAFSARNKIYAIEYRTFAQSIQRQARTYDQSIPFYRDLALQPDGVLVPKLFQLVRDRQISMQTVDERIDRIFLPEAFTAPVYEEYRHIEENPDVPFPDEDALKLPVPHEWIQAVSVESDLPALISVEGDRTAPLYRLMFPEGLKSMVLLSAAAGDKLLEYAVLKIRNYLRKGTNKDFIQQRLMSAFPGKEHMLKDSLQGILTKPFEMVEEMRQSKGDFVYSFWAYLTTSMRKDLANKGEPMPDDMAAHQASYIVDVYNNFYKGHAQRGVDRESAFKTLNGLVRKPPYVYSINDISDFRDGQGHPLLGKYTREELEEWIADRTTKAPAGVLPELLFVGVELGQNQIIAKDRLLPYIVKLLSEARAYVKTTMTRDWQAVLYDFASLPSMEDDDAFRADLAKRLAANSPLLASILATSVPSLVYQEFRGDKDATTELDRCFADGRTAPADLLLDLNRKRLLVDVRMLLPFWYTVPVLSWFIGLWKRASKRKDDMRKSLAKAAGTPADTAAKVAGTDKGGSNQRAAEFGQAARAAEKAMLPSGYSLDDYLCLLVSRWNSLLDPRAKANLTEDINNLVKDYLRGVLRSMKPSGFTPDRIETMAANLADRPNLLRIRNHAALEEYIRLYMVKILKR